MALTPRVQDEREPHDPAVPLLEALDRLAREAAAAGEPLDVYRALGRFALAGLGCGRLAASDWNAPAGAGAGVYAIGPDGEDLTPRPLDGGPQGRAIARGQLVVLEDGPNAVLAAPLVAPGETLGAFELRAPRGGFSAGQLAAVRAAATVTAAALERTGALQRGRARNARLERALTRMEALRDLDRALAESLDPRFTLNVILEHARKHLEMDAASVTLLDPASGTLAALASTGYSHPAPPSLRVALGEGLNGRVAAARRTLEMPDLSAVPLCAQARDWVIGQEGFSAAVAGPLVARGKVLGTLVVFRRAPLNLCEGWHEFFEALSAQAAVAMDNAQLVEKLEGTNADLSRAYDKTIEGWARALDLRDEETEGHSRRVTEMTVTLARAVGMPEDQILHVRRGALLHDVGKLGVPDAILHKPGPLTPDEWAVMRRHPGLAVEMLEPIEFLRPALDIPRAHHERWDGSGYPRGLQGEAIPLAARLFAPVDVFDALTNARPYRPAWTVERTLAHVQAGSGTHFDPQVVEVFMRVFGR